VLAVCCVCCGPYRLLCVGGVPCGGKHIIIFLYNLHNIQLTPQKLSAWRKNHPGAPGAGVWPEEDQVLHRGRKLRKTRPPPVLGGSSPLSNESKKKNIGPRRRRSCRCPPPVVVVVVVAKSLFHHTKLPPRGAVARDHRTVGIRNGPRVPPLISLLFPEDGMIPLRGGEGEGMPLLRGGGGDLPRLLGGLQRRRRSPA